MLTPGSDNCINKVRIVGNVDDSLAFQLRLQSLLSSTDFSVPGVSPSSVVCIRSVPDPRPRTLRLVRSELEGAHDWSAALIKSIANKISRAQRPETGAVLNSVECVLFADKSEMLVCIASDWLSGLLGTRWWWKTLLGTGDSSEIVKQLWRDHPQYIPAALDQLGRQNKAASFVSALTDNDCHELLQQVVRSFAMHELIETSAFSIAPTDTSLPETVVIPSVYERENEFGTDIPRPWLHAYEVTTFDLSREQERFLGIALTIQRAPSHGRSRKFARAVDHWQKARVRSSRNVLANPPQITHVHDEPKSYAKTKPAVDGRETGAVLHQSVASIDRDGLRAEANNLAQDAKPKPKVEDSGKSFAKSKSKVRFRVETLSEMKSDVSGQAKLVGSVSEISEHPTKPVVSRQESVRATTLDTNVEAPTIEIQTQLGGLFYLINLALYLNLYGDFTMPSRLGIELNIWDFVALVGAELLGDDDGSDPIWSLLASLAGRKEGQPVGANFYPEDEWRLPPEWLFSDDRVWRWSASRGRLRVLHTEGFPVLDLPLATDVRGQLQREIEPYRISNISLSRAQLPKLAPLRSKTAHGRSVRRWLSRLMTYVRARLRVALGLDSNDDIAALLCRRYARVRATDTHADVFFSLADLPLAIRCAGLDRDPGWVPAAGRFIAFRFD